MAIGCNAADVTPAATLTPAQKIQKFLDDERDAGAPTSIPTVPTTAPLERALEMHRLVEVLRGEYQVWAAGRAPTYLEVVMLDADHYVAVYLANTCVQTTPPTLARFRSYLDENMSGTLADVSRKALASVHYVVARLTDPGVDITDKSGSCATPYQEPASATDVRLATDVVKGRVSRVNPQFRSAYSSRLLKNYWPGLK